MLLSQFRGKGNRCGKKAVRTADSTDSEVSVGRESELVRRLIVCSVNAAVRAARATGLGAGAKRFVDDGLDGACAPATFGAAAEATINLLWIAREVRRCAYGIPDIVVAKDVAGTNDHKDSGPIGDAWHLRY
jgi:hypothetical protein